MAITIVGIHETRLVGATIGASWTYTKTIYFDGPSNIWARPYLQRTEWPGDIDVRVGSYVDDKGLHIGPYNPGIFANKCTSVTYRMDLNDCGARAVLTTIFFG